MLKILDLTRTIKKGMPVFPGTEQPKINEANTIEKDGFKESLLTIYSHTGTHMDAPAHIFVNGTTLDEMHVEAFTGPALVIDCQNLGDNGLIDMTYINPVKEEAESADFLIFKTGWESKWGKAAYYENLPKFDDEVLDFIVNGKFKGIGIDAISIDPVEDTQLTAHFKILGTDAMVVVENLCNLDQLPKDIFHFSALPMKFEASDGAPVRAMAMYNEA